MKKSVLELSLRAMVLKTSPTLCRASSILVAVLFLLTNAQAANPSSGGLNPVSGATITWRGTATGGTVPNGPNVTGEQLCQEGVTCETYTLTLSGTRADWINLQVHVQISWQLPATDYDLYIHKDSVSGPVVGTSGRGATSPNEPLTREDVILDPAASGTGVYAVRIVYYAATQADQYSGTATVNPLVPEAAPPPPPSYQIHAAPAPLGQSAGEPSIGANWKTGNAWFIANLESLRVTFDDSTTPARATWINKSASNTSITSFDPILFTDQRTSRTFVSQLLPSKMSLMSFSDDDGETWTPSQGSGINSGVDHQTIGGGPYARNADGSLKGGAVQRPGLDGKIYPNAIYYASQDVGLAEIARSDDGGVTFGVAVPMYDIAQCGGLHGHIKVAPDGTIYVPNKSCGGKQAVVVSEDNGLTWEVRALPGSTSGRTDPSVGIGADGTLYFGYANGDGHARAAVSHDKGKSWESDRDIGSALGVQNSVFPAAVAGDNDRAAVFFLGTTTPGTAGTGTDQTQPFFDGTWYGFIATTYNGGQSWVTVNSTPNDPVQRGVICTNGTTCPSGTRNLLDFNDLTVDKQGRALAAFADGCVTPQCVQGVDKDGDGRLSRFDNDGKKLATIIRQTSGRGLFKAYDSQTIITTAVIEDDDPRIEYSSGWHKADSAEASAGHFRHNNGNDQTHYARLLFDVQGQTGAVTYHYATSPKGHSAEIFLDGVSKGVINYNSAQGTTRSPEFGHNVRFEGLSTGQHILELRAIHGTAYIDGFTLESASTNAQPFSGPGATSSSNSTINAGQQAILPLSVTAGTQEISISAESSAGAPVQLVLIDPAGLTLATADNSTGVAVINRRVTQAGIYQIKVINVSLGPIQVWTASTPLVAR